MERMQVKEKRVEEVQLKREVGETNRRSPKKISLQERQKVQRALNPKLNPNPNPNPNPNLSLNLRENINQGQHPSVNSARRQTREDLLSVCCIIKF
jgi:hypothetical protein